MYVARIPNRGSPPAILLRESYREGAKVKNRTLANLSHWPEHKVDALVRGLKGLPPKVDLAAAFEITRSLPHGHVAAVLGTAERCGLAELIDPAPSRQRDLVCAMVVAAVIAPDSKLATAGGLRTETATSSLGEVLGVARCDEDDLYAAMDGALARQEHVENALAARHLTNGTLVIYDVSSAVFEGLTCPLGAIGHARDGVRSRRQIVYGLLCSTAGMPVAIEVFEGNTATPKPWPARSPSSRPGSGWSGSAWSVIGACSPMRVFATSCGRPNWIGSAPCGPRRSRSCSRTARCSCRCSTSRTWSRSVIRTIPGSGWCAATTRYWPRTAPAHAESCSRPPKKNWTRSPRPPRRERRPLRGRDKIALRVGKVIGHYNMAKHFPIEITNEAFKFTCNTETIAAEAALDGIYLLRTSLPADTLPDDDVVLRYKGLEEVERFFRTLNSELDVRPIRHRLADRVRAHMFLRMLSYYISWHMKQALAPILFYDNDKPRAAAKRAKRANRVAAAQRSDQALTKAARKRTEDGIPVHSLTSLLADLATICANYIQPADDIPAFTMITSPTRLQRQAFELLAVSHRHGYA